MSTVETDPAVDEAVEGARSILRSVIFDDSDIRTLAEASAACGTISSRVLWHLVSAAKVSAALSARKKPIPEDLALACQLVLGVQFRPEDQQSAEREDTSDETDEAVGSAEKPDSTAQDDSEPEENDRETDVDPATVEQLVEAAAAAHLSLGALSPPSKQFNSVGNTRGSSQNTARSAHGGRVRGTIRGDPRRGRIDLPSTIIASAPWQKMRGRRDGDARLRVWPSDFRIKDFEEPSGSSVIFVVDASGSAALHRLAEVKGAIEHLLSDCYSRRDVVSVVAFRGARAEVLVPPTPSLLRVRRALAGLPGGGGTPLPAAIDMAARLAQEERAAGRVPLCVFLSDGRGNIALDGAADRAAVRQETARLAALFRRLEVTALFFDTSSRPRREVEQLSADLGADYRALPYPGAADLGGTVEAARVAARGHAP